MLTGGGQMFTMVILGGIRHVATYGCESWTRRKNEETRLGAFEMKGLRFFGFCGQQRKQSGSKDGTVRHHRSKEVIIV